MSDILDFIWAMLGGGRWIEMIAVVCGLLCVWLIVVRSIWNYAFGLVMVTLYIWIFYQAKLYSDMLLQVFFIGAQLVGLWLWLKNKGEEGEIIVERMGPKLWFVTIALTAGFWYALGTFMGTYTDAHYPYWDASIAAISIAAQLLMAFRFLENWAFWIVVDILAIGLYFTKDLYPTSVLYTLFLAMAVIGLVQWRRARQRQHSENVTGAFS